MIIEHLVHVVVECPDAAAARVESYVLNAEANLLKNARDLTAIVTTYAVAEDGNDEQTRQVVVGNPSAELKARSEQE